MHEHTFGHRPDRRRDDERATERAFVLCEELLERLGRPDHDWTRLRDLTLRLSRVASAMAGPPAGRSLPPR